MTRQRMSLSFSSGRVVPGCTVAARRRCGANTCLTVASSCAKCATYQKLIDEKNPFAYYCMLDE